MRGVFCPADPTIALLPLCLVLATVTGSLQWQIFVHLISCATFVFDALQRLCVWYAAPSLGALLLFLVCAHYVGTPLYLIRGSVVVFDTLQHLLPCLVPCSTVTIQCRVPCSTIVHLSLVLWYVCLEMLPVTLEWQTFVLNLCGSVGPSNCTALKPLGFCATEGSEVLGTL